MRKQGFWIVLWPAFLMAGVMEMLVFAVVSPGELHGLGGALLERSDQAVYTVAFLVFWTVTGAACAMTWLLCRGREEVNSPSRRC